MTKLTKTISTILLATVAAGMLGGCFVETGRHRHHSVIVIR